ncbi:MAG: hypothetical protein M3Q44_03925 [bacterium]|nr:hypothetical protein [bacterium]
MNKEPAWRYGLVPQLEFQTQPRWYEPFELERRNTIELKNAHKPLKVYCLFLLSFVFLLISCFLVALFIESNESLSDETKRSRKQQQATFH